MKKKTRGWTILSLCAAMGLSFAFAVAGIVPNVTVNAEETVSQEVSGNVAKVGDTEYATMDDAVAAWTAGTTLTLLSNVQLSGVITLESTSKYTLNLGTYTMTAASGNNAIEITPKGVGTASRDCLIINADSANPGGITATGKACIYYNNADKINDRMTVTINGGVFNGSYTVNSTSGPLNKFGFCTSPLRGQGAPYYVINGGTFNAQVYLNAAMLKVTGGTFNQNLTCMGDQTAYRSITGGRFSNMTMTADAEHKFYIGNRTSDENGAYVAHYDVGCYVDSEGYLVVGGPIITDFGDEFKIKTTYSSWSGYLAYSSANENGLYYKSVEVALTKNNVKLLMDEIDLTEITAKLNGSVSLGADDTLKVKFDNAEYLPTFKTSVRNSKVVYVDSAKDENGVITRTYSVVEIKTIAEVSYTVDGTVTKTLYKDDNVLGFINGIEENATITLYEDIDITPKADETQAVLLATTERYTTLPDVFELPDNVTINGNGKTITGTIYTDNDLTINSDVKFTTLYLGVNSNVTNAGGNLTADKTHVMEKYTFSLTPDKSALKATEALNLTVSIDKAFYSAEYTLTYDTTKFSCAADTNDDGVIFVSNLFEGEAGVLATYTLVAKNDIQSVYEGDVFAVNGNVVQIPEQLLNGIENEVVGDTETIKISLNYTAGVKADFVQGYSLVLVKGDDAGYAYNGVKMFYVEAYGAYAILVEGNVTAEMIDAALSKTTDCEMIRQSYNVNAEFVNDGVIDIKDSTSAYACSVLDFDVADYMELYLRADVNGDCKVNMVDINAVVKNYTK